MTQCQGLGRICKPMFPPHIGLSHETRLQMEGAYLAKYPRRQAQTPQTPTGRILVPRSTPSTPPSRSNSSPSKAGSASKRRPLTSNSLGTSSPSKSSPVSDSRKKAVPRYKANIQSSPSTGRSVATSPPTSSTLPDSSDVPVINIDSSDEDMSWDSDIEEINADEFYGLKAPPFTQTKRRE